MLLRIYLPFFLFNNEFYMKISTKKPEFEKAWKSPISRQGGTPPFEPALAAYRHAMRKFPNSRYYEHALYKTGLIYNGLGYFLEARTVFEEGIKRN